jgi:nucleoside-diphosphate-sugar epimerase
MQTILGSGGTIGVELAKALNQYTNHIRLVSRNPKKVNSTDELYPADLLNPAALKEAIKGSEIVYSTIGFEYNTGIWQKNWPVFMRNLLDACGESNCKLVFFDNIYMYDQNSMHDIQEESPVNPPSKKGKVRAEIAGMILKEIDAGNLTAMIVRSADFYGPGNQKTSMLTQTVLDPLSRGKKASWMGSVDFKHSFTYTPDAGKATALLGNTNEAYNQVWHLPTASNPLTGKEWIEAIANEMGVIPNYQVATKFILRLLGLFIPIMREMPEMMYQYDRDYIFISDKFEKRFNLKPTSYHEGIKAFIQSDYK